MRPGRWPFAVFATLIVVTIAVLGWQHRRANELRGEIARQRAQTHEQAQLRAENRRLAAEQPTAAELADLAARRRVAEQLRSQLAAMHQREKAPVLAVASEQKADSGMPVQSLKGNAVARRFWQNAGQATPDAAFQTTLWASAAGDIDSLADLLKLDPEAGREAAAAFDRLPAVVQNELGTPDRLIALLTAMDVPLGSAAILGQFPTPTDTRVSAQLIDADGQAKVAVFSMRADGDRWRLMVPSAVVKKYAGWLQAPAEGEGLK